MKLNQIWGYGQLFGFSAIDGENSYKDDFVATYTSQKFELRFETNGWMKIHFPLPDETRIIAAMSDFIEAPDFFCTFFDKDTLLIQSPVAPVLSFEFPAEEIEKGSIHYYKEGKNVFAVFYDKPLCVLAYGHCKRKTKEKILQAKEANLSALKAARYAYYENMPVCKDPAYEALYYKALAINKVNMRSAEGNIPCMWTTPDRVPHRHMWLWDSAFHAMALVTYNEEAAKDAIRAVLSKEHANGFIPHTMKPFPFFDKFTQPQVLSWAVWTIFEQTNDLAFLKETAPALEHYLSWVKRHRDVNKNGLLEWYTDQNDLRCKCAECGQDNSPRFDFDEPMDAIDFSVFFANDAHYMSLIFSALSEEKKAQKWEKCFLTIKKLINQKMWNPEEGAYFDLLFNGQQTNVLTPNSFLPIWAGIPSKENAAKMVKILKDPQKLWTAFPLASISATHPEFSNDMWRGGVWININYLLICGLKRYGYDDLAKELRHITLEKIQKWYLESGTIFEFYDPADQVIPYLCKRKGECPNPPDWRIHYHSITDYNWSACLTLLLIQNIIL